MNQMKANQIYLQALIPAWISNHTHYEMWDEISYPFLNYNCCIVEVWEWMSNFIPHITRYVIIHAGVKVNP